MRFRCDDHNGNHLQAVILAELSIDGKSVGPHLFWAPIQTKQRNGGFKAVKGVTVTALPDKIALKSLDNA